MSNPGKAVFVSYASQDSEAAKRICDALRADGIEVWFDQSELRGGDAWDWNIRNRDAGKGGERIELLLAALSALPVQNRHRGQRSRAGRPG